MKFHQVEMDNLEVSFQQDNITLKARAIQRSRSNGLLLLHSKWSKREPRKTLLKFKGISHLKIIIHFNQTAFQNEKTRGQEYNEWINLPTLAEHDQHLGDAAESNLVMERGVKTALL